MFFNKPLEQVTFDDIVTFCANEIKENEVLDYKITFPRKLEKVLSAFANTYGGTVIIGVGDVDGKPETNPAGLDYADGLEERVQSIIMSNISPPIFPQIHVCNPVSGKTFIVIQVEQSVNTPHAIDNNTKVYVRTGNITKPERLVDIDNELHWLKKNRENSIHFRHDLLDHARSSFQSLKKLNNNEIQYAELSIYCIPYYPQKPFFEPAELKSKIHELTVRNRFGDTYPAITASSIETMPNGIYFYFHNENSHGKFVRYTAIDNYGLVFQAENSGAKTIDDGNENTVRLSYTIGPFIDVLKFYRKLQKEFNILGSFLLRYSLVKMQGVTVYPVSVGNHPFNNNPKTYHGKCFNYENVITTDVLNDADRLNELLIELVRDLHWGLGVPREQAVIEKWIGEQKIAW